MGSCHWVDPRVALRQFTHHRQPLVDLLLLAKMTKIQHHGIALGEMIVEH
jgi:predicted transposase YdaD